MKRIGSYIILEEREVDQTSNDLIEIRLSELLVKKIKELKLTKKHTDRDGFSNTSKFEEILYCCPEDEFYSIIDRIKYIQILTGSNPIVRDELKALMSTVLGNIRISSISNFSTEENK